MITKTKLLEHVKNFPDEMELEELIERLIFIEKLEQRIKQSDEGNTVEEKEIDKMLQGWSK